MTGVQTCALPISDTSEKSGDIFKVGNTKTGEDRNGKPIYKDVFSLAKPLLMKLATAAGIQFHPEHTTVCRENANTYVGKAFGAVRLPDGTFKTHPDTKRICLDDEEAKYRLEFMDKSIMGIHDWRAAKAAADMFKGEWKEDPEKLNQWNKPEKYYVIADCDREKYVERSVLVNMTLLRKTASEKAQTGAILRVIRALLGIKGTYLIEELQKPFAVPTVTFSPDYSDANVRQAMLQQGMNSMGNMFGTASAAPAISSSALFGDVVHEAFDPEDNLENPAFASDMPADEDGYAGEYQQNTPNTEPDYGSGQASQTAPQQEDNAGCFCDGCGAEINEKVYGYSINKFGRPLCMKCQRGAANG